MGSSESKRKNRSKEPKKTPLEKVSDGQLLQCFSKPSSFEQAGIQHTPLFAHRNGSRQHRARARARIRDRQRSKSSEVVKCSFVDILPPELIMMIIWQLDYVSLAHLAATNSVIEKYFTDLPWYKFVMEYCQEALWIMAKLQELPTVRRFNSAFTNPTCSFCGEALGRWVYLPECSRCCDGCLCDKFKLATRHYGDFAEYVKISRTMFRRPPTRMTRIIRQNVDEATWYHRPDVTRSLCAPFPFFDREAESIDFGRGCKACNRVYIHYHFKWTVLPRLSESSSQISSDSYDSDFASENPGEGPSVNSLPLSPSEHENCRAVLPLLRQASERVFSSSQLLLQHIRDGECRGARKYWKNNRGLP